MQPYNPKQQGKTAGDKFIKEMADIFNAELKRKGLTKHHYTRRYGMLLTAPTFYRMLDGESGANCRLVADVADTFGYELKLVPKSEIEKENEVTD